MIILKNFMLLNFFAGYKFFMYIHFFEKSNLNTDRLQVSRIGQSLNSLQTLRFHRSAKLSHNSILK